MRKWTTRTRPHRPVCDFETPEHRDVCSALDPLCRLPILRLGLAAMAAMLRPAYPCSFGLAVVPTLEYYMDGLGGQIDGLGVEIARVIAPANGDLAEWAKSCLELDEHGTDEPTTPYDSWSPGRSVAVNVTTRIGARACHETLFYRCMDHGHSDVQVFADLVPGCMARWAEVWRKFLIVSWNMLQRRNLSTRRVLTMIRYEVSVWDPRWVQLLAEHVDEYAGGQRTSARIRAPAWY